MNIRRFGQIIKVKPEKLEYYLELHRNPWPCVIDMIHKCNISNYSIFIYNNDTLFAYFEYSGTDFESDMKLMADDPCTRKWWAETDPCQESLSDDNANWWMNMEEIFHC